MIDPACEQWAHHRQLIDHLEVGVALVDEEQRVQIWNRWLQRHADIDASSAVGRKLVEVFPEAAGSRLEAAIAGALGQRMASLLSPGLNAPLLRLYQRPSDRTEDRRMRQLIHIVPLPAKSGCLIQVTDVTASARREDQLRHQSAELRERTYRDTLTGVGNRRRFNETMAMEFRRAVRASTTICLLMIDIDHFKHYNDEFGNPAGDECLRQVAQSLAQGLRDSGDLVARYGGEEFSVILPATDGAGACQVAERLRQQVAQAMAADSHRAVTVSIGVAVLRPGAGTDSDSLISGADMALYQAKADGRNRVAYFNLDTGELSTLG